MINKVGATKATKGDGITKSGKKMNQILDQLKSGELQQALLSQMRPWGSFFNAAMIRPPPNGEWATRIQLNVAHFRVNYAIISFGLLLLFVISNPSFMVGVGLISGAWYGLVDQKQPITIAGRTLNEHERLIAFGVSVVFIFWIFGVGSSIFFIIGLILSFVLVHATMLESMDSSAGIEKAYGDGFGRTKV